MRKLLFFIATSAALLAMLAAGCSRASAAGALNQTANPPRVPALTGYSLAGTSWVLVSYGDPANLKSVIPGTKVSLNFNSDTSKITGNGGINGYGGDARRTDNQLSFSSVFHTEMASLDQAVNEQENAYFNLLITAQSVDFGSATLTINCAGSQVLNFSAASSPTPAPSPTTCLATSSVIVPPPAQGSPSATAGASGTTSTVILPTGATASPPTSMVPPTPPTDVTAKT